MNMIRKCIGLVWAVIKYTVLAIVLTVLIHVAHALTLDKIVQYTQVQVSSPYFPVALGTYRMAFIADTHAIADADLQQVVDRLNTMDLDVLLLGGDFSRVDGAYRRHLGILSQVQTRDGIWGVAGNYDHSGILLGPASYYGIEILNNWGTHLHPGFYLAGTEDIWHGFPDYEQAMRGHQPNDFVLFLAHNPDASMRFASTNIDLMLSGHTHGGQITLFGLYAPVMDIARLPFGHSIPPSAQGQRFTSGFARADSGTLVYVNRGVGHEQLLRVFARPEVTVIELTHGAASYRVRVDWLDVVFWSGVVGLGMSVYAYRKVKREI